MPESTPSRPPLWVLSLALFPLGLGGLYLGAVDVAEGFRSARWQTVEGRVVSSRLVARWGSDQPEIRYQFVRGDHSFMSDQLWPGTWISALPLIRTRSAEDIVRRFPVDSAVTVHVHPRNPVNSAIIPGPRRALMWMAVLLAFFSLGIASPFAVDRWMKPSFNV